ncbi:MAG: hypothetical protein WA418_05605 [Bradyrhizobium sp.]
MIPRLAAIVSAALMATPAMAESVSVETPMTRIFACRSADGPMEVYIPQDIAVDRNVQADGLEKPVTGLFIQDMTKAERGKLVVPVRVSSTADRKAILVDQDLAGGKPTIIPIGGGKVDFSLRFGRGANCGAYNSYK